MNNTKYLVGLAGLVAGFLISFLWVSSYNKNNAPVATQQPAGAMPGSMPAAGSSGGQQAMTGQIKQIIDKAQSNSKDFQAQLDAAAAFDEIKRTSGTVEYLARAYDASPEEFIKRDDLKSLIPQIAMYYSGQKTYDKADVWIKRALETAPTDNEMRIELAASYLQREPPQPDKAIAELQTVINANPKDGHALGHLVEAYALKKDAAGAEGALNRLREADPSNNRLTTLQNLVADLKAGKPVTLPKEQ